MEELKFQIFIFSIIISFLSALISGITSFLVTRKTVKSNEINEDKKIFRDFSQTLIEKRIEVYPELWGLVSSIYGIKKISILNKKGKGKDAVDFNLNEIRPKLREWRKENGIFLSKRKKILKYKDGEGGIFDIESSSLSAFQDLEEALYLKSKYSEYDEPKINNINKCRNILLLSIQEDIGILEKSEKNLNCYLKIEMSPFL